MDDGQQQRTDRLSYGEASVLAPFDTILLDNRIRVIKHEGRNLEANLVLSQVGPSFRGIPLKPRVHTELLVHNIGESKRWPLIQSYFPSPRALSVAR